RNGRSLRTARLSGSAGVALIARGSSKVAFLVVARRTFPALLRNPASCRSSLPGSSRRWIDSFHHGAVPRESIPRFAGAVLARWKMGCVHVGRVLACRSLRPPFSASQRWRRPMDDLQRRRHAAPLESERKGTALFLRP